MKDERARCAEFVVRSSFVLTGRGTCVVGFIQSGTIRRDDEVRWMHDGSARVARCIGIESIREVPLRDPPSIALMVNGAEPADFIEGETLALYR